MPGQVSWLLIELRKKLGCCAFSVRFSGLARQGPTYRAKPAYPSPRGGGSQEGCWGRLSLPCRCAAVHLQLARVPSPAGPLVQLVFRLSGNTVCRRGAGPAGGSSLRMCLWRAVERRYFRTLPVLRDSRRRVLAVLGRRRPPTPCPRAVARGSAGDRPRLLGLNRL